MFLVVLLLLVNPNALHAKNKHKERHYQEAWCNDQNGEIEFKLKDRTRVDCLTDEFAIEFDFGKKWAESIGQSLYYSFITGKKAGVVLILTKKKHYRYWLRLNSVIDHNKLPITTWRIIDYE